MPEKRNRILFALVFILSFFLFDNASAQNVQEEDVVHLKNGSIIRGKLIEQVPGIYLKIEILGGSVFVYPMEDVELITKEPVLFTFRRLKKMKKQMPITYRHRQVYHQISNTYSFGEDIWGIRTDVGLHYRAGYYFNHHLALGMGVGMDGYESGMIIPVYVDFQGDLLKKKITPHYALNVGYGFGAVRSWLVEELKGGPFLHAAAGWKINTRKDLEWIFDIGYKLQHTRQIRQDGFWWGTEPVLTVGTRTYQKIVFRATVGF